MDQGPRQAVDNINTLLGNRTGVLGLVFRMLPPRDLKNVLLVCQFWREVGEPVLWARSVLKVTSENMTGLVETLSGSRRLKYVRNLRVIGVVPKELLQAMAEQQRFKLVDMASCITLSEVEPELLARAVAGLEEVDMWSNRLTKQQAEAILRDVCTGGSQLKILKIRCNSLSSMDSTMLARAVNNLVEVNFCNTKITHQQTKEIFTAICAGGSRLKTLAIEGTSLAQLDSGLLATAVNNLEQVDISNTELTNQQTKEILTVVCGGGSRLKTLIIAWTDLSSVEEGLLARAVTSLEEVNLGHTNLTKQQLEAILKAISKDHSQLKSLDIGSNNLSLVEPCLLSRAVTSLENMKL